MVLVDLMILGLSVVGGLVIGWVFTDVVTTFHIALAGFVFFSLIMLIFLMKAKSSSNFGSATARKLTGKKVDSPMEAMRRVNQKLKQEVAWEQISVDTTYTKGERKWMVNKKTQELEPHWAILSEMKESKLPVLIIYAQHRDSIEKYEPVPPALRRDDMFKDFDPIKLERVMSRGYREDKEEKKENQKADIDFNIKDERKAEEDSGGGWFR